MDLSLHEQIDLPQRLLVDRTAGNGLGAGKHEGARVGAGNRDTQRGHSRVNSGQRNCYACQRIIDGAAHADLRVERGRRLRPQMYRYDELAGAELEMCAPVLDIELVEWN